MLPVNKALENYAPIAPDHFLANVGRELQGLNAHLPREEMLRHAERILLAALDWVREDMALQEALHDGGDY